MDTIGLKADPGFVHLNVRSSYSLLEGALTVARIAALAKADHAPAVALTDDNLFGALEFSEKLSGGGVQPIVGLTLSIDFKDREQRSGRQLREEKRPSIVLLGRSETGYRNLMALSSQAFLDGESDSPHATLEILEKFRSDLIVMTGGPDGPIDRALGEGTDDIAAARLQSLMSLYGDGLYVELQRQELASQKAVEGALVGLAYKHGLPLVATNGVRFGERGDHESHDALICLAEGRVLAETERRQMSQEHYFKSRAEMAALFADLPEALASTVEIARRCVYRPRTAKPILPRFTVDEDEAAELRAQAVAGLARRLAAHPPAPGLEVADYEKRLDFELGVITNMKFPGYFLIVADFIKWAKDQGIPVGPGRGSGAGSLVAYALTITDLDPLRFGLLFERFLNPERVSMPDFDIDFCQDRREEVIRYVQARYGHDRVAQIITFGTLQARGVMRDVGRVLEMPYGQVDKLCKLVPNNPAAPVTLKQAVEGEPKLQEAKEDPTVGRMLDIALKLEGLYRHASTHAAGIVIGDRPLSELVPLYRDPRSDMPVTQFNMKWVEPAGLVKFDFLGLKTLTTLTTAVALLKRRGIELDLDAIPIDDAATYAMLSRGETVGVFQLESAGMRRALADMKPDRFEDIIALVALYRPGPMANIPVYCAIKHGKDKAEYLHPKLEPILGETFGVIIYQEQVMQTAQSLAGYSLGEADMLRRAMGKKIRSEMDAQRERFVTGAKNNGIGKADASTIFDLLAKFADYGFNKSHAAAYALVAYQTAYLKANFPVEFMAASMTLDMGVTDKLAEFRQEAVRLKIDVKPPCVNRSDIAFDVADGAILYALAALKGVGASAVEGIVAERRKKPFADLNDFAKRLDAKATPKRALESLIQAGALDSLSPDRARTLACSESVVAIASRTRDAVVNGQDGFNFGASEEPIRPAPHEPWTAGDKLKREYESIGFFLSGHPLDDYAGMLDRLRVKRYSDFVAAVKSGATAGRLAATVLTRQERKTKTGNRMGVVVLSDPTGHYEAVIFSEGLALYRDLLEPNTAVIVSVSAVLEGDEVRIRLETVEPLDRAAERHQKSVRVFLRGPEPYEALSRRLEAGDGEVSLVMLLDAGSEVEIRLPGKYRISPQITGALKTVPGVVAVEAA